MIMNLLLRLSLLSIIIAGVSSCGFSLRGSEILSSKYQTLQLNAQQPNSDFTRLLRRSLQVADVSVAAVIGEDFESEFPVLAIADERLVSRPVTVNPRARAAQYELRLSINIALGRGNELFIEPETIFVERTYFEDIENISGNQEELELITAEMRRELVNQLMRRLEAAVLNS